MNTILRQCLSILVTLSLSMFTNIGLAGGSDKPIAKPATTDVAKKAPSFLFVIDAKQGEIKKDTNGQFHLMFKHADMNHVIMFSDRPNRIVKTITGKDLQKLWPVGKNSFEKDPPNAVLSGTGIKTQIVILNGIHVTKDAVSFPISVSAEEDKLIGTIMRFPKLNALTLTIDPRP